MKKYLLLLAAGASLFFASCNNNNDGKDSPTPSSDYVVLKGDLSTQTLTADKKYLLSGFVYVTSGNTLTIEPGTLIKGEKSTKGTLVITRGAKIMANGTADNPIVFTSQMEAGSRKEGDWGGVILLGQAPINPSGGEAKIEGGLTPTVASKEKEYIWYGGNDAADNSGSMKYVRIEFAGVPYSPDNEINGLTFGGVGNGTQISYIQVYRSGDDAFEWFGGTVNCDHLLAIDSWDDDFDTDFGFSGHVQFGLAQRWKNTADVSGSNGFESDNDGNGSENLPQTKVQFSNMTIVGPVNGKANGTSGINGNFQHAAQIRRNSSESIVNSIFMGFPVGLYIDDSKVANHKTSENMEGNLEGGKLIFRNNIIAGCTTNFKSDNGFDLAGALAEANIQLFDSTKSVKIVNAYKFSSALATADGIGTPDFRLQSGSPALTGASFGNGVYTGFQQVPYLGAFDGSTDWTAGWANWDADNTKY